MQSLSKHILTNCMFDCEQIIDESIMQLNGDFNIQLQIQFVMGGALDTAIKTP